MCLAGQPPPAPATAADAAAMARAALGWLAAADAGSLTTAEQADCLRALEQAESMHTAARARMLGAFRARGGVEDDGHGSAPSWLRWQTRITHRAAPGAVGGVWRLSAPPPAASALAAAEISASRGRPLCQGTALL